MSLAVQLSSHMAFSRSGRLSRTISILSVVGIGIAVAALLVVLAVVNGFRDEFARSILRAEPHIIVRAFGSNRLDELTFSRGRLSNVPGVEGAAPFLLREVLIAAGGKAAGGFVRGVDEVNGFLPAPESIIEGVWPPQDSLAMDGIGLGKVLAERLNVVAGDTVLLATFLSKDDEISLQSPRVQRFRIDAILDMGIYQYNNSACFMDLEAARRFYRIEGGISGMEVAVRDPLHAEVMAQAISDSMGYPFYCTSWTESNAPMFAMLSLQKKALFLILTIMIVVATANVISGLSAMAISRRREIGVLMAMGMSRPAITRIFMWTGLAIGAAGFVLGGGLAVVLVFFANSVQLVHLAGDVYQIESLPLRLEWADFCLVAGSVILIAMLATVAPARRAARLMPVEVLRYE